MPDGVTVVTFCPPHIEDTRDNGLSIQITLNKKLSRKLKKWCKFSYHVKVNSHKHKLCKMRPACTEYQIRGYYIWYIVFNTIKVIKLWPYISVSTY